MTRLGGEAYIVAHLATNNDDIGWEKEVGAVHVSSSLVRRMLE